MNRVTKLTLIGLLLVLLGGCATIVNDPNIPLAFSFSDGSSGQCEFKNKRGSWSADLPATNVLVRRSDDDLIYNCTTEDGKEVTGAIRSEVEGEKMAASVIFWDLGITDAITDKHRTYQGSVVIPVPSDAANSTSNEPNAPEQSEGTVDSSGMSVAGHEKSDAGDPAQSDN
jgi:hypothetical protein